MKVGIFADIHGNIYAFKKVWKSLKKEACDKYLFLGDICGYYYHQNEIIEILRGIENLIPILGNHDDIFLRILKDEKIEDAYTQKYGKSYILLKNEIKSDNLNYLKKLPQKIVIGDYGIILFHGSPWDYLNEYIYPTDSLDRFRQLSYRFVLLGHTHYPMDRAVGSLRIINPGSCGQPRNCNRASYAVLDCDSGKVGFRRVEYNANSLIKDIKKHSEENSYLIDVLTRSER